MTATYDQTYKDTLDSLLLPLPEVTAGKMFGYPAYFTAGRLFACLMDHVIGLKVPADLAVDLLLQPFISPFQPFGKAKMKEWIQINRERPEDLESDISVFLASITYVSSLGPKIRPQPATRRQTT